MSFQRKHFLLTFSFLLNGVFGSTVQKEPYSYRGSFSCDRKSEGFYADVELDCEVFHYCDQKNQRASYKCQGGTKFDKSTSTCLKYLENGCGAAVDEEAINPNVSTSRIGRFFFPEFPTEAIRRTISKAFDLRRGIGGALAALSPFDRKSQKDHISESLQPPLPSEVYNEWNRYDYSTYQDDSSLASIKEPYYDANVETDYSYRSHDEPSSDSQVDSTSQTFLGGFRPSPTQPVRNAFETFRQTISAPNFPFKENPVSSISARSPFGDKDHNSHQAPIKREKSHLTHQDISNILLPPQIREPSQQSAVRENSIDALPRSHAYFNPPGSLPPPKQSSLHSSKPVAHAIHPISSTISPFPFDSAIPPFSTSNEFHSSTPPYLHLSSTPPYQKFFKTGYEADEVNLPSEYYDDVEPYRQLNAPAYYDTINYDDSLYYTNPVTYRDPYSHSQLLYPYGVDPNYISVLQNYGQAIPLTGLVTQSEPNHFQIPDAHVDPNLIDDEDEIPKTLKLAKETHASKISTDLPIPKRSFVTKNHVAEEYEHPVNGRTSLSDFEVTTYSPPVPLNVLKKIKKEVTNSRMRKPGGIRKTVATNDPFLPPVLENDPFLPPVLENSSIEDEAYDDDIPGNINFEVTPEIREGIRKVPAVRNAAPEAPILSGSLKDRVNRLGTRRRTLNQAQQKETVSTDTLPPKKDLSQTSKPLRRPVFTKEKEPDTEEPDIPVSSRSKLKSRITDYFRQRSPSRTNDSKIQTNPNGKQTAEEKENNSAIEGVEFHVEEKSEIPVEHERAAIHSQKTVEHTVQTQSKGPITKIKRKMDPEVRAKFKEFLQNRRNNSSPTSKKSPKTETSELQSNTDNDFKEDTITQEEEANDGGIDIDARASHIYQKSIPLVRQQKIVKLDEVEQPVENKLLVDNHSYQNSHFQEASSSSKRPFRYQLRKRKKNYTRSANNTDTKSVTNVARNKYRRHPVDPTAVTTSPVTSHVIVRPKNFKQIVKMYPQQPERANEENSSLSLASNPEDEAASPNRDTFPVFSRNIAIENIKERSYAFHSREKSDEREPKNHDQIFSRHKLDPATLTAGNAGSDHPRPIFNLDEVSNDHYKGSDLFEGRANENSNAKLSSLQTVPFFFRNETPRLPIEILLPVT